MTLVSKQTARSALSIVLLLATGSCDSSDVLVYSRPAPTHGRDAKPFTNPYTASNPNEPGTPETRIRLKEAAGSDMKMPTGTYPWSVAAWGKYVFVGNYDENASGVFQDIEDQRIGVFDTETKQFCELDLNPSSDPLAHNGSVEWVDVADPSNPAATRVYFVGFAGSRGANVYQFGYVEARMDTPSPCDPVSGWRTVGFTGNQLNAARLPGVIDEPCPNGGCGWDGLGVLDPRTVVMGGWLSMPPRLVVARLEGPTDTLRVVAVRPTEPWKDPGSTAGTNDVCYTARPVGKLIADPTRAPGDQRFAASFDPTCDTPVDVPGCAPHVGVCPNTPPSTSACTLGTSSCAGHCSVYHPFFRFNACTSASECQVNDGACVAGKCSGFFGFGCQTDADCRIDLGSCVTSCEPSHPDKTCRATGNFCIDGGNCPGDKNPCDCTWEGKPVREFAFNGTNLTPTGGYFQPAERRSTQPQLYDSSGNLWINDINRVANQWGSVAIFHRVGTGHRYDTTTGITPPDQSLTAAGAGFLNGPALREHDGSVYMNVVGRVQRARFALGAILKDPSYNRFLGESALPSEAKKCLTRAPGQEQYQPCNADADCAEGTGPCHRWQCFKNPCNPFVEESCEVNEACSPDQACSDPSNLCREWAGTAVAHTVPAGGSPASLWKAVGFRKPGTLHVKKNFHLLRVPLGTPLPEHQVQSRPGVAWTGGDCASNPQQCRLWLVAVRDGTLQFRVRDDGFWSGWRALPAASVPASVTGGPALVATPTSLAVYARTTSGEVQRTTLSSATTCAFDSCEFGAWQAVPMTTSEPGVSLTTAQDVAAALVAGDPSRPVVAVRDTASRRIFVTAFDPGTSSFGPWSPVDGAVTDAAPSLAYDAVSAQMLLAVRDDGDGTTAGQILFTPVLTATSWQPAGTSPPVSRWGTAPALVSNGAFVHVFAAEAETGNFDSRVHQAILFNGSSGAWRRVSSEALATFQPAGASVGGDVNLVTRWFTDGLREQALD